MLIQPMLGSSLQRTEGRTSFPGLFTPGRGSPECKSRAIFTNKYRKVRKQACRRSFRAFETISGTYQNQSPSKPWAIAKAFCSKSADFEPFGIYTKSLRTSAETVKNLFASIKATLLVVWDDFQDLSKSTIFKTMAYSPGSLLEFGRIRTLGNSSEVFTNRARNSSKCICKHVWDVSGSLKRFPGLTTIHHLQNHGL